MKFCATSKQIDQVQLVVKVIVNGGRVCYRQFCAIIAVMCARHASIQTDRNSCLEVEFVDRRAIRKLNAKFRGKDRATDVLSFRGSESSWIGSVVLCVDEIRSRNPGVPILQAIRKTLIHGVLHVFGYDHETDDECDEMVKKEQEVYSKFVNILRFCRK